MMALEVMSPNDQQSAGWFEGLVQIEALGQCSQTKTYFIFNISD